MKKIFIIKSGTTFEGIVSKFGDFENWILRYMDGFETEVIDAQTSKNLPNIDRCAGVIITGSHAMVTEELDWSLKLEEFIRDLVATNTPLFGICYGHQLIAKSLGGVVDYHPDGMELGTVEVFLNKSAKDDEIFKHLPQSFDIDVVHSQSVIKPPKDAIILASNSFEKNHAFKIEPTTWAVQFHPEYNADIMRVYVSEVLKDDSEKKKKVLLGVKDTNEANKLIKLFVDVVRELKCDANV